MALLGAQYLLFLCLKEWNERGRENEQSTRSYIISLSVCVWGPRKEKGKTILQWCDPSCFARRAMAARPAHSSRLLKINARQGRFETLLITTRTLTKSPTISSSSKQNWTCSGIFQLFAFLTAQNAAAAAVNCWGAMVERSAGTHSRGTHTHTLTGVHKDNKTHGQSTVHCMRWG